MNRKSVIISTGSYLPKKIMTNYDLEKTLDTSHQWILERTGIIKRHIGDEHETTSYMAIEAAKEALKKVDEKYKKIDAIIVATTTPDKTFPAVATLVQSALQIKDAFAFDVQAVCSGFVYALSLADNMIKTEEANNVLVIGADKMSKIVDWQDRSTCILFADGAGAVIVSAESDDTEGDLKNSGIISKELRSDGSLENILYTDGGVSSTQKSGYVVMKGQEVFKHAIEKMISSSLNVINKAKITTQDINWLIPHQANIRILQSVASKLSINEKNVIITVDTHANTSAATIPLAMDKHFNKFKRGDYILLTAAGGGFTWGSILLRW
jgi:3-oxoacyl-[acyl-carrier-protein] synthase-3